MKLYCTNALQRELGERYEPAPLPTDPLDSWCAQCISLSPGCVLVALTEIRFAVLLWNIPKGQLANLNQLIVQRIREVLASYEIPQDLIDRYIPANTVLKKCGAATGTPSATMTTLSNRVQKLLQQGKDPQSVQNQLNTAFVVRLAGVAYNSPLLAIQKLLQEYEPPAPDDLDELDNSDDSDDSDDSDNSDDSKLSRAGVPAMELEASLDLGIYKVCRNIIVPADINFHLLHSYLQIAFDWAFCHIHEFILPARKGRRHEMHLVEQIDEMFRQPGDVLDRNYKLKDCLIEGDIFEYIYDYGDYWEHKIRVRRIIPACMEDLPVCTLSKGVPPPEDVGGVPGFQDFYRIMQNPKDPEYEEMLDWVGGDWPHQDDAKTITFQLHNLPSFIEDF